MVPLQRPQHLVKIPVVTAMTLVTGMIPPAPTFRLIPRHVIKSGHIITPRGQKMLISRNLLKTMLDFFFCPIQLYIEMYCDEEKSGKSSKMKF